MPSRSGVTFRFRRKPLLDVLERRQRRLGIELHRDLVTTLSKPAAARTIGGKLRAIRRAIAGRPPRKLAGDLVRSAGYRVIRRPRQVVLRVGVQEFYGRFLELNGHPFLRPLLRRRKRRIRQVLLRGAP